MESLADDLPRLSGRRQPFMERSLSAAGARPVTGHPLARSGGRLQPARDAGACPLGMGGLLRGTAVCSLTLRRGARRPALRILTRIVYAVPGAPADCRCVHPSLDVARSRRDPGAAPVDVPPQTP